MKVPATTLGLMLLTATVVLGQAGSDRSVLYKWTDDQGIVHITDNLGKVPSKYRPKVVEREVKQDEFGLPEEGLPGDERRRRPEAGTAGEDGTDSALENEIRKAEWQATLRDWQQKLNIAEQRQQAIKSEMDRMHIEKGLAPLAAKQRVQQLESELAEAQKQSVEARHMVEVVIPERARKAGIPPGWLRE